MRTRLRTPPRTPSAYPAHVPQRFSCVVVEAKPERMTLSGVHEPAAEYQRKLPSHLNHWGDPLRFDYEGGSDQSPGRTPWGRQRPVSGQDDHGSREDLYGRHAGLQAAGARISRLRTSRFLPRRGSSPAASTAQPSLPSFGEPTSITSMATVACAWVTRRRPCAPALASARRPARRGCAPARRWRARRRGPGGPARLGRPW